MNINLIKKIGHKILDKPLAIYIDESSTYFLRFVKIPYYMMNWNDGILPSYKDFYIYVYI